MVVVVVEVVDVVEVVRGAELVVTTIPVVVKLATGVVVLGAYRQSAACDVPLPCTDRLTRVVTVCVVGGVVVVVVVLERLGFQMSKTQKVGSRMGADSAPKQHHSDSQLMVNSASHLYLRQNSVPLDAPTINQEETDLSIDDEDETHTTVESDIVSMARQPRIRSIDNDRTSRISDHR